MDVTTVKANAMNYTVSYSTNASSLRGNARKSVAAKWANHRRKQQLEEEQQHDGRRTKARPSAAKHKNTSERKECTVLPLCVMIQRSWREAVKAFQQPSGAAAGSGRISTSTSAAAPVSSSSSKRASFPSVLSVLQANALKQQVESFQRRQANDEEEQQLVGNNNMLKRQPSLLKVLPANFDFQQAITEMSKSRSRVFWLLDLAAIVQAHVKCRKDCKLAPRSTVRLQLAYRLHHNANPKLLQVLHGLGVAFQVATKYDVQVCRQEFQSNPKNGGTFPPLYDDPNLISKPNSFYRQLILDDNEGGAGDNKNIADSSSSNEQESARTPLTVDGPDEVVRLVEALSVMASRRQQAPPTLTFTLKLDASSLDLASWQTAWDATQDAALENGGSLVGLALVLPTPSDQLPQCLSNLLSVLEHIENRSKKNDHTTGHQLQLYLSNPKSSLDSKVADWLAHPTVSRVCQFITLDVSQLLVAEASALCTRIIGVKENEPGKIHYYIDDGCYGSLSNVTACGATKNSSAADTCSSACTRSRNRPVPLQMANKSSSVDMAEQGAAEPLLLATVWGPTCDGLDKVCSDIKLPKLGRDDWLVFGDIGFCDVGTAFNGFDPPDIAYCVLGSGGYYAKTVLTTAK